MSVVLFVASGPIMTLQDELVPKNHTLPALVSVRSAITRPEFHVGDLVIPDSAHFAGGKSAGAKRGLSAAGAAHRRLISHLEIIIT